MPTLVSGRIGSHERDSVFYTNIIEDKLILDKSLDSQHHAGGTTASDVDVPMRV